MGWNLELYKGKGPRVTSRAILSRLWRKANDVDVCKQPSTAFQRNTVVNNQAGRKS